MRCDIT